MALSVNGKLKAAVSSIFPSRKKTDNKAWSLGNHCTGQREDPAFLCLTATHGFSNWTNLLGLSCTLMATEKSAWPAMYSYCN